MNGLQACIEFATSYHDSNKKANATLGCKCRVLLNTEAAVPFYLATETYKCVFNSGHLKCQKDVDKWE